MTWFSNQEVRLLPTSESLVFECGEILVIPIIRLVINSPLYQLINLINSQDLFTNHFFTQLKPWSIE